ncbi:MAG: L-lactate permease [Gemmataceae bacterium]
MLLALYTQNLDPFNSRIVSTIVAALPVIVLFWLLVPWHKPAPLAGAAGAMTALIVAVFGYGMAPAQAGLSFLYGAAFGLLPIGWTVMNAMLLYNVTVVTGQFAVIRRSVAGLSADARIQAILVGFSFGAFLEGAAGAGTPVAICGAVLVGLGFDPIKAAVLCLIANTSPVAYGGLGVPLITLGGVTDIPIETLSVMAGRQLPFLSVLIPLWMVRCMCDWRRTLEVWPALLVAGGSFAVFQFFFAASHLYVKGLVLYPMTDVGGGFFSLVVTGAFLRLWQPKHLMTFHPPAAIAEAEAKLPPLTIGTIAKAWAPFIIMSALLMGSGLVRQREARAKDEGPLTVGPVQTNYMIPVDGLHQQVERAVELRDPTKSDHREKAEFNFAWVTAPGSPVCAAALISMLFLRMSPRHIWKVIKITLWQMRIPIPTIGFMLGLSYVTRYSGMDATLGVAFAQTGLLYPFFAALLGWLGVFLTGTDAGSNALFGSLQKITATRVHSDGAFTHLGLDQAQVLICTANSTGGVMGKMIDAQSICVATAATDQVGREADIFKAVVWHSIVLASIVGALTLAQAYLPPLTNMVPRYR